MLDERGVVGRRRLDGEEERSVRTDSETLGDQVVGLAGGGLLRVVALIGERQAQSEDRERERHEQTAADEDPCPGPSLDDSTPPIGERVPQWLRGAVRNLAAKWADGEAEQESEHDADSPERPDRWDAETDAEQRHGGEAGGDEAPPAGDLEPVAHHRQERRQ